MSTLIERLRGIPSVHDTGEAADELERMAAGIEVLKADAERYRWLRAQHWSDGVLAVVSRPKEALKLGSYAPSHELLDDVIDAAIALLKETK